MFEEKTIATLDAKHMQKDATTSVNTNFCNT